MSAGSSMQTTGIRNKMFFRGIIRLTSALHIGGGSALETETQAPIVRTPAGEPYIPGSSLKGVFRSFVEQAAVVIPGISACQLNDAFPNCASVGDGCKKWKDYDKKKLTEEAIALELETRLCSVCKVFGSPWRASRSFFSDAAIMDWPETTQIRHGVVINRDSETGVRNLKYDYEIIPVSSTFGFSLVLENSSEFEQGLVAIGLNEMISGLMQLGGKTSRGAGNFILENLEIYSVNFADLSQLKNYLRENDIERKMLPVPEAGIKDFLTARIDGLFPGGEK